MLFAGIYCKGLFPQPPNDTLGFSTSLITVNPRITASKHHSGNNHRRLGERAEIAYEIMGLPTLPH